MHHEYSETIPQRANQIPDASDKTEQKVAIAVELAKRTGMNQSQSARLEPEASFPSFSYSTYWKEQWS